MKLGFFLDLLFPKRCVSCGRLGAYVCGRCLGKVDVVKHPVCPKCLRQVVGGRVHPICKSRYGLDGLVVATRYRGPVKILIRKLKYRWVSGMLAPLLYFLVNNISLFDLPQRIILVPVPLHNRRKRWRGFNQAQMIAENLGVRFGVPVADVLTRVRETKPQVSLTARMRKANIIGAFGIRDGFLGKVSGRDIVLVDDVYTTGSTMGECTKVLKKAGAREVWGMVLALG